MCVTAILAGAALVASAVGTYASIKSSNAQADQTKYLEQIKRKQLSEQAEMNRLEAGRAELERSNQYAQERSSALAAIGASGLGDHISFFQGLDPANLDAFHDEVRAVRLNLTHQESQIRDGISVSGYASKMAGFNSKMSNIGSLANFAGDVVSTFQFYNTYKTPKKGG